MWGVVAWHVIAPFEAHHPTTLINNGQYLGVTSTGPKTGGRSNFELPDHFHGPVGGFRDGGCGPREDGSGCVFSMECVGLAVESAQPSVGAGDLHHFMAVAANK